MPVAKYYRLRPPRFVPARLILAPKVGVIVERTVVLPVVVALVPLEAAGAFRMGGSMQPQYDSQCHLKR